MTDNNPYAPPKSHVADIAVGPTQPTHGFKLGASLFWRVLVLQTLVGMPLVLWMSVSDFGQELRLVTLKPTIVYTLLAGTMAASLQIFRPGLLYFIWGHRLDLLPSEWRRFSWAYCCVYLALAVANVAIALLAPMAAWVQFKLFVPLPSILALCLIFPRFLAESPRSL